MTKSSTIVLFFSMFLSLALVQAQKAQTIEEALNELDELKELLHGYKNIDTLWLQAKDVFEMVDKGIVNQELDQHYVDDIKNIYVRFDKVMPELKNAYEQFAASVDTLYTELQAALHAPISDTYRQNLLERHKTLLKKEHRQLIRVRKRTERKLLLPVGGYIFRNRSKDAPIVLILMTLYTKVENYQKNLRIDSLTQHIDNLSNSIANLERTKGNLQVDNILLNQEQENLRAQLSDIAERSKLTNDTLNQLLERNAALNSQQLQLKATVEQRKAEQTQLIQNLSTLEQNLSDKVAKVREDEGIIRQNQEEINQQANDLEHLQEEIKKGRYALNNQRLERDLYLTLAIIFLSILVLVIGYFLWRLRDRKRLVDQQLVNANEKLKTLFRELHHRTKNNLQTVSSLLGIQAMGIKDPEAAKALTEAKSRIQAIGVIHRWLYQGESLTRISMKRYIHDLVAELQRAFSLMNTSPELQLDLDDLDMEADTAMPIGLIINEIINNAFKHAFNNHPNPKLTVAFKQLNDDTLKLQINDNGPGLPEGLNIQQTSSFGLKMVRLLVHQLEGTLDIQNQNGAHFALTLKLANNK